MRKIKLFIASSLDGFIADKDGKVDWLFTDSDYGYSEFYDSIDTLLIGRKTYEQALSFGDWPYSGKKCYVFTSKNLTSDDNVIFSKDPVAVANKLIAYSGKDIWLVGGTEIITELLNNGLVREVIISIHPVILGNGFPLFKDIFKRHNLELIESQSFKTGLVQLHYKILN